MTDPSDLRKLVTVVGHKNPDTDAICSAIGQAAYMNAKGIKARAIRCGEIPARTQWVLQQAGMEVPDLEEDIRPTAGFLCEDMPVTVFACDTLIRAYIAMRDGQARSLPVVNKEQEVVGLIQFHDLLELLMPPEPKGYAVRTIHASLNNLAQVLEAKVDGDRELSEEEEDLIVLVGASSRDDVTERLRKATEGGLIERFLVTCGDRPSIQRLAIEAGVRLLVVTGGARISSKIHHLAEERGVTILVTRQDTASTTMLLRCSRSIANQMRKDFVKFEASTPLSQVKAKMANDDTQDIYPVVEDGTDRIIGVLGKSDLVDAPRRKVVLVDHNEFGQAVNGIEEAEIVQVIDHHRLGGDIRSREPIHVLCEPVGSTSTLVAREFFRDDLELSSGVALCLCAGILSDTLNLTSPTTTPLDGMILKELCEIAGVTADEFTREFFAAGSLMKTGTVEEIIGMDRKDFEELGWKLSLSQIEELGFSGFDQRRAEIEEALQYKVSVEGYDFSCLLLTDISTHQSMLLVAGEPEIIKHLSYPRRDETLFDAPGVVSRKKQLLPAICTAVHQVGEAIGCNK